MKSIDTLENSFPIDQSVRVAKRNPVYRGLGKRIMDIILALILLVAISPILAIAAIMTRRDGGPAIYTQTRIGKNGRKFNCYKFRSMIVGAEDKLSEYLKDNPAAAAEWNRDQKLRDDPRITKWGHFIRKTSIDELPQLVNVLKGEMSFLGPRPFMEDQEAMYRAAGGKAYFKMRPGISGMWQVHGRGETTFIDRVNYDEAYYSQMSLMTDVKLSVSTVRVVLGQTGH